jgi:hypothetical protein
MHKDYRWLLIGPEQAGHARSSQPSSVTTLPPQEGDEIHLFARGQESTRITIRPRTRTLQVCGPGRVQKLHEFPSETELTEFLQSFERSLVDNGWTLLGVNERRIAGRS